MEVFDVTGPLPDGDHAAGGERRHRQDVDHLVPGDPLRRRGALPSRRAAGRDVRAGGQRGAAAAGPRAAGRRRTRPRRRPGPARRRRTAIEPLLGLLLAGGPHEVAARHARVREALSAFDGATIATTHQFCQMVLTGLGIAGDTDAGARLVEDLDELVAEVVDDLYVRGFASQRDRRPSSTARRGR